MNRILGPTGRIAGLLALVMLAACAAPQTSRLIEHRGDLPLRAEVASVPFFPQEDYYCGPAALATVLAWSDLPVIQEDLVGQVYTPGRKGSLRSDVVSAARRNGRLAVPVARLSDLLAEIAAGHPVLVFQNLALDWLPQWHFAVAIGYDLEARELVLRSGTLARRVTVLDAFERTWARGDHWALVVLSPNHLPASGDETAVLRAAVGLERSGKLNEAATAYGTIQRRWPGSLGALMGLGNVRYAQHDLSGAETAFRQAIVRHADAPVPWNNLAYVLLAQGRRAEAIEAARKAVQLAGDNAESYRATLQEITEKSS